MAAGRGMLVAGVAHMSTLRLAHRKDQQKIWERQRLRAGRLFARGWRQADVARRIGVDPRRVNDWHKRWQAGGLQALRSKGPVGGKSKLDQRQWRELERVLKAGPKAAGFDAGGWTLARIASVVAEQFGVVYHRYGLWYLLRRRGWRVQHPTTVARERDEATIAAWRRRQWPRVRKRSTTTWGLDRVR
jgi:transposase